MLFELKKLTSSSLSSKFITLTKDERQKQFIKLLSKGCQKGDTVIYYLTVDGKICGFVGLSASKIDNIPCINIDYIHVVEKYRKLIYTDLDNKKISEYLVSFCLSLSSDLKKSIGFRWLVLTPDNSELEKFYTESFKFIKYKTQKDKITYLFIAI
jgi:hypothetical protein